MRTLHLVPLAAAVFGLTQLSNASAAPIQITFSAISGGTFNGTSFLDRSITITANGDTQDVQTVGSSYKLTPVTAVVTVDGLGSDSFAGNLQIISQSDKLILGDITSNRLIFSAYSPKLANYNFSESISPTDSLGYFSYLYTHTTNKGGFMLFGASVVQVMASASTVPEPTSAAFATVGALVALILRSRKRHECRLTIDRGFTPVGQQSNPPSVA